MSINNFTSFSTVCPRCGKVGDLWVIEVHAQIVVPLHPDGFDVSSSLRMDTTNEVVYCKTCHARFPLNEVTL